MIGVIGHLILLAVGLIVSALVPAPASQLTLWSWLHTRRTQALNNVTLSAPALEAK